MTATAPNVPGTNTGHGHIWPRPDRMKARCGGPRLCPKCRNDQHALTNNRIRGVRVYRPNPDRSTDAGRPIRIDLHGHVVADLSPDEAVLVAAQLAAAIRNPDAERSTGGAQQ